MCLRPCLFLALQTFFSPSNLKLAQNSARSHSPSQSLTHYFGTLCCTLQTASDAAFAPQNREAPPDVRRSTRRAIMRVCTLIVTFVVAFVAILIGTSPTGVTPPNIPPHSTTTMLPPWPIFRVAIALNEFFEAAAWATRPPPVQVKSLATCAQTLSFEPLLLNHSSLTDLFFSSALAAGPTGRARLPTPSPSTTSSTPSGRRATSSATMLLRRSTSSRTSCAA